LTGNGIDAFDKHVLITAYNIDIIDLENAVVEAEAAVLVRDALRLNCVNPIANLVGLVVLDDGKGVLHGRARAVKSELIGLALRGLRRAYGCCLNRRAEDRDHHDMLGGDWSRRCRRRNRLGDIHVRHIRGGVDR
jgi:hypothetical protein